MAINIHLISVYFHQVVGVEAMDAAGMTASLKAGQVIFSALCCVSCCNRLS